MPKFDTIFTILTFTGIAIFAVLNADNVNKLASGFTTNAVTYVQGIGRAGA